jgi:hypothetical protein
MDDDLSRVEANDLAVAALLTEADEVSTQMAEMKIGLFTGRIEIADIAVQAEPEPEPTLPSEPTAPEDASGQ